MLFDHAVMWGFLTKVGQGDSAVLLGAVLFARHLHQQPIHLGAQHLQMVGGGGVAAQILERTFRIADAVPADQVLGRFGKLEKQGEKDDRQREQYVGGRVVGQVAAHHERHQRADVEEQDEERAERAAYPATKSKCAFSVGVFQKLNQK